MSAEDKKARLEAIASLREEIRKRVDTLKDQVWEILEKDFPAGLEGSDYLEFAKVVEDNLNAVDLLRVTSENAFLRVRSRLPKTPMDIPSPLPELPRGDGEPDYSLPLSKKTAFLILAALEKRGVVFESNPEVEINKAGVVTFRIEPFIAWFIYPVNLSWPLIHVRLLTGEVPATFKGTNYYLAHSFLDAAVEEYQRIMRLREGQTEEEST